MSQITNLNVSPYYDDFDSDNNYHRVLFKPGYPIQARELTTLPNKDSPTGTSKIRPVHLTVSPSDIDL